MKCIRAKSKKFIRPSVVRFNKSHERAGAELVASGDAVYVPKHCAKRFEKDEAREQYKDRVRRNFQALKDSGKLYRRLKRNTKGAI